MAVFPIAFFRLSLFPGPIFSIPFLLFPFTVYHLYCGWTRDIHRVLSADVMVSGNVVWFAYFSALSKRLAHRRHFSSCVLAFRLWKRNETIANHITAWSLRTSSI
jgi:hypothetical protein